MRMPHFAAGHAKEPLPGFSDRGSELRWVAVDIILGITYGIYRLARSQRA
ncbi:hypothetical protein [Streptomyces sp. NBC_01013]|nr:hypothetical protein OG538_21650 [Streptomyces sp. NBC_01013]